MMEEPCNQCGKKTHIQKLISGTCYRCREEELREDATKRTKEE